MCCTLQYVLFFVSYVIACCVILMHVINVVLFCVLFCLHETFFVFRCSPLKALSAVRQAFCRRGPEGVLQKYFERLTGTNPA